MLVEWTIYRKKKLISEGLKQLNLKFVSENQVYENPKNL
jgi:hypothetical protein